MLIFERTKTKTPIAQQDLAPILISPPQTCVHNPGITTIMETSEDDTHIQTKPNTDKLCETKQNQYYSPIKKKHVTSASTSRPSRSLSSPPLHRYFSLYISLYNRSANIHPVLSNRAPSTLYHNKTRPLTADWLQGCFVTRFNTVVKSGFQKLLSAPLMLRVLCVWHKLLPM